MRESGLEEARGIHLDVDGWMNECASKRWTRGNRGGAKEARRLPTALLPSAFPGGGGGWRGGEGGREGGKGLCSRIAGLAE